MLKGLFSFHSCFIVPLLVLSCISCNQPTSSQGQVLNDSVRQATDNQVKHAQDTLKQRVSTSKDSILKVLKDSLKTPNLSNTARQELKNERKRLKDSVRSALDTFPKHVYLTFDDGPLRGSAAIDSIARLKNIKISAFLIGKHANMSKGLKRDFEKYVKNPLVGSYNHSYTHADNRFMTFYNNPAAAFADFEKNEHDLQLKHKIVRLPGRNIWIYDDVRRIDLTSGASTADMLYANGYKIFGWDVEWKINGLSGKPMQSVQEIYGRIKSYMNNKSSMEPNNVVLLMHDDMFQNKQGQKLLLNLIDSLQLNTDYKFEMMGDYPFRY